MPANIYDLIGPLTKKYGEDIIQDALLRTWQKRPALLEQPSTETLMYLSEAAKHLRMNAIRDAQREYERINAAYDRDAQEPPVDEQLEMEEYERAIAGIKARSVCRQRKDQLINKLRQGYVA
jgi:DNA-directed RNA polymerase specialized sigma24 family protein